MKIFIKVAIFGGLIDFTRQENLDLRKILMTSLREGRKFIDLFLCQKSSHLISVMFSEKENQTLKLLSKLQKSTRQLQALCTHGKLRRYVRMQPFEYSSSLQIYINILQYCSVLFLYFFLFSSFHFSSLLCNSFAVFPCSFIPFLH